MSLLLIISSANTQTLIQIEDQLIHLVKMYFYPVLLSTSMFRSHSRPSLSACLKDY